MWTTAYTHETTADPDRVWRLLADVDGWGRWNAGIAHIALDGPLAVGATFRMTPPGEPTLLSTVAELEPGRRLTDVTEAGGAVVRVVHELAPLAGGGARVSYRVEVDGVADTATAQEIGQAVSADFPDVLAALAATAEAAEAA